MPPIASRLGNKILRTDPIAAARKITISRLTNACSRTPAKLAPLMRGVMWLEAVAWPSNRTQ